MESDRTIKDVIRRRRSIRTFDEKDLPPELIASIEQVLALNINTPFKNKADFRLLKSSKDKTLAPARLGTYGFIKGARWFFAGICTESKESLIDYGYQMESIILELTFMGLGTCWLGGTFSRAAFAKGLELREGQVIPAVSPVGYPAEKMGVREKLIRRMATSDRRKQPEELFSREVLRCRNEGIQEALELVRLAPSAENAQPWRIQRSGKQYHFYMKPSAGVVGTKLNERLQLIDMGISMSHWELSLREAGIEGEWGILQEREWEQPEELEYIATWDPVSAHRS